MSSDAPSQPVAVIIGAATGIGAALANEARKRGYRIATADFTALQPAAGELHHTLDVRDHEALQSFAEAVFMNFGQVDLLFNNAGIMRPGRLWDQPRDHLDAVLDINLGGVINGVRAFLPLMIESGRTGRIVNTASLAGLIPAPGLAAYTLSKHAVVALSETLAIDLATANSNLSVSVVCPGAVATNLMAAATDALTGTNDDSARAAVGQMAAGLKRIGAEPERVATVIFDEIAHGRFCIIPTGEVPTPLIQRANDMIAGNAPAFSGWGDGGSSNATN